MLSFSLGDVGLALCRVTEPGPLGLFKNEVFVRLTADWKESRSAVCSGPPELLLVSERSGRARFVIRKKRW